MCTRKSAGGSKITEQYLFVRRNGGIILCTWQREEFGEAFSSTARLNKEEIRMRRGSNGETAYFYKEL